MAETVNDELRREVAEKLRRIEVVEFDDGEFCDCGEVEEALGLLSDDGAWYDAAGVARLAELIDPPKSAAEPTPADLAAGADTSRARLVARSNEPSERCLHSILP